jgi:hypothetical protein
LIPPDAVTFKINPGLGGTSQRAIIVGVRLSTFPLISSVEDFPEAEVTSEQVFADDNDAMRIGGFGHTVNAGSSWMTVYTITLFILPFQLNRTAATAR